MSEQSAIHGTDINGPAGYMTFGDALFRKQKKNGWRIMEGPMPLLEAPVADTHAHVALLENPALSLARCALQGVDFVCSMVDAYEDGDATYGLVDQWRGDALRLLPGVFEATRASMAQHRADCAAAGNPLPEEMTADEWRANRCPCETVPVPRVRVAAGVHPHNASHYTPEIEEQLLQMLANPLTCALGEVGLDYHYDLSPRSVQRDVFRRQVQLAHATGLPLILHMRDAHDDGFQILEEEGWPVAGVLLHCCSVGPDELQRWIDRGAYVAFGGAVTFARSEDLRASATIVPASQLLTETDAPYMAPVPFRGVECSPEFTIFTAEFISSVRGQEPGAAREALLQQLHENALRLLDRQPTAWQTCASETGDCSC